MSDLSVLKLAKEGSICRPVEFREGEWITWEPLKVDVLFAFHTSTPDRPHFNVNLDFFCQWNNLGFFLFIWKALLEFLVHKFILHLLDLFVELCAQIESESHSISAHFWWLDAVKIKEPVEGEKEGRWRRKRHNWAEREVVLFSPIEVVRLLYLVPAFDRGHASADRR